MKKYIALIITMVLMLSASVALAETLEKAHAWVNNIDTGILVEWDAVDNATCYEV